MFERCVCAIGLVVVFEMFEMCVCAIELLLPQLLPLLLFVFFDREIVLGQSFCFWTFTFCSCDLVVYGALHLLPCLLLQVRKLLFLLCLIQLSAMFAFAAFTYVRFAMCALCFHVLTHMFEYLAAAFAFRMWVVLSCMCLMA